MGDEPRCRSHLLTKTGRGFFFVRFTTSLPHGFYRVMSVKFLFPPFSFSSSSSSFSSSIFFFSELKKKGTMLRLTNALSFRNMTFQGMKANRVGGHSPLIGGMKKGMMSSRIATKGYNVGKNERPMTRRSTQLAKEFSRDALSKTMLAGNTTYEFHMKPRPRSEHKGDLDRAIQHLIVSLQRQINYYGRREEPQRTFLGECFLRPKPKGMRGEDELVPTMSWVETKKKIDTGYIIQDADLIPENRDEVLYRIRNYFKTRHVRLTLDRHSEYPSGFSCVLAWDAKDDAVVLTPEDQPVPVPRIDVRQPSRTGVKGVGLGLQGTAM